MPFVGRTTRSRMNLAVNHLLMAGLSVGGDMK